jgi:signal transduction histidine kinase
VSRGAGLRVFLALVAASLAAGSAVLVLAFALPPLSRRSLGPASFAALVLAAAALAALAGAILLFRAVARPVERILDAAAALGTPADPAQLPLLGDPDAIALGRAALAFERLASQLAEERTRLAAKVAELTAANRQLADARESLARSERLATVGRLAAGLAHEVGNPLGAIAGYVELARARLPREPDPELVDSLARIDAAAARIDRTVRGLLDFARPAPVQVAPVDLAAAVDASVRLARVQPRFRDVDLRIELEAGLPPVLADEHHLAQVLLNLLLNAGDAMRGRAGAVRIAARRAGDGVRLEVADDGPGIAAEDLPRVFDPFFTRKEPGEGTGLGLAISHRLVETFGGEIAAGNRAGGGAVLSVTFRAAARSAAGGDAR